MNRCKAKTHKGKECSRQSESGSFYCWQHKKEGEWDLSVYVQATFPPRKNLPKRARAKINALIKRGPAKKADKAGYVYIFRLKRDCCTDMWKIGCTSRSIETRMKEWNRDLKGLNLGAVILELAIYVDKIQFCERIIHAYFDDVRIYRYECDEGLISVKKIDNEPLSSVEKQKKETHGLKGKKHVEWFFLDKKEKETAVDLMRAFGKMRLMKK